MIRTVKTMLVVLCSASAALAGARIDLRVAGYPSSGPPEFPQVFLDPGTYTIDVYMVDTGNPQGDIYFRGLFLDASDTVGITTSPTFTWTNPFGIGAVFDDMPYTSWVYPLPLYQPLFMNGLPDNGELLMGTLGITLQPGDVGVLDLLNANEPDVGFGARADFGYGGAGDPVTTWRAYNGDITGGKLGINIPEPSMIVLLLGTMLVARRTKLLTRTT